MLPLRVILLERGKIRPERSRRSLPANPAVTMPREHDSDGADLQQLRVYTVTHPPLSLTHQLIPQCCHGLRAALETGASQQSPVLAAVVFSVRARSCPRLLADLPGTLSLSCFVRATAFYKLLFFLRCICAGGAPIRPFCPGLWIPRTRLKFS